MWLAIYDMVLLTTGLTAQHMAMDGFDVDETIIPFLRSKDHLTVLVM